MSERLKMVYTMEHWIGISEYNKKYRKIIDLYNNGDLLWARLSIYEDYYPD